MSVRSVLVVGAMAAIGGCGGNEKTFDQPSSGGTGATGGTAPSGGTAGTSGTGGSGMVGGSGGTSGAGGTGMAGAAGTGTAGMAGVAGSGGGAADCGITQSAEISSAIATVGIVTFSAGATPISGARIEFGLDTSYGMTAPVDLAEPNYRTLLLGMKQSREYHYRIVVTRDGADCPSQDYTLMTGELPNILPNIDVENIAADRLFGGFLMTGQYQAAGGSTSPAYIIDSDGDMVWGIAIGDYVTGVRMSYDGKYMWINGTDNTTNGGANIHRVTMDGLVNEDLSDEFGIQDHQITILPDETVIFYGHDGACPDIKQRFADGRIETIVNAGEAHGAPGMCHVNHIEYSPEDDTLIFSDDNHDNYTKVRRQGGEVVWVLGGTTSDFTGDGAQWSRQHGLDVLGVDRVLYFNNGAMGSGGGSIARELLLDTTNMTATRVWDYAAMPPIASEVLGDVQRLPNGNTVIAYSAQGVVHEVDADGVLLQEMVWPLGGAFGYIHKRATLYGPPPR